MVKVFKQPTDRELDILRTLWERGSCTVRQVHEVMGDTGYTTTLKLMQIMSEKGLVVRDESQRTHIYRPAEDEAHTQGQLVGHLIDKAFGGSAKKLVIQALAANKVPADELERVKKMLEKIEGKEK
ncbi:MAG: BlaI/MecI/CopY family transcriptional regulator [Phycisphaerae bacterium]|nr:BlaI/MecI/CopY family transcriptional regulator [Phycisphaerae bacterium]